MNLHKTIRRKKRTIKNRVSVEEFKGNLGRQLNVKHNTAKVTGIKSRN